MRLRKSIAKTKVRILSDRPGSEPFKLGFLVLYGRYKCEGPVPDGNFIKTEADERHDFLRAMLTMNSEIAMPRQETRQDLLNRKDY